MPLNQFTRRMEGNDKMRTVQLLKINRIITNLFKCHVYAKKIFEFNIKGAHLNLTTEHQYEGVSVRVRSQCYTMLKTLRSFTYI